MIIGEMGQYYSREIAGKKIKLWIFPKLYFKSALTYVINCKILKFK